MGEKPLVNFNCRRLAGDRPCPPHKETGAVCEGCRHYEPVSTRILIIKLDAVGDVLRTTSVLPALKEKYPGSQITWITKPASVPLFLNNPYVDRVFDLNQAVIVTNTDRFDVIINLDASPASSRIASMARGGEKIGFLYSEEGHVYPANPEAREWFLMGIRDDLKKANSKTYQRMALEICRLPFGSDKPPVLNLSPEELGFADRFAREKGIGGKPVIGFNTGAGGRWEQKKWTLEGYLRLASLLKKDFPGASLLLCGGPEERGRNAELKKLFPDFIDTGTGNSLREFASLIGLCDILVTGDTLAMHIAIALKKKLVVLFGPTSAAEIELYGLGEKIVPDIPCFCCYRSSCTVRPSCMERITPEEVRRAIKTLLE
jgi:ADP-heptose:LPS heptosyltransferase